MQKRPVKIYVSRSLKYPPSMFKEIVEYLESQGFLVTYYDTSSNKYSTDNLRDADVLLCLVKGGIDIVGNNDMNRYWGEAFLGKGQHEEVNLAKREGKLVLTNHSTNWEADTESSSMMPWHQIPDSKLSKAYIKGLQVYLVDESTVHNTDNWKKKYGCLKSHAYGKSGADLYKFVTGWTMTAEGPGVKHQHNIQITDELLILLLI